MHIPNIRDTLYSSRFLIVDSVATLILSNSAVINNGVVLLKHLLAFTH